MRENEEAKQRAIEVAERQEETDVEMASQPEASSSAVVCLFFFIYFFLNFISWFGTDFLIFVGRGAVRGAARLGVVRPLPSARRAVYRGFSFEEEALCAVSRQADQVS